MIHNRKIEVIGRSPICTLPSRIMESLVQIAKNVLSSYTTNSNTGNIYEITACLTILRRMGLTNDMITELHELFTTIRERNHKDADRITIMLQTIQQQTVGNGCSIEGEQIIHLVNVTQDDTAGNTGDILLITNTKKTYALSIQEGKPKRGGGIEKCLSNPAAYRFGCSDTQIETIKTIRDESIPLYKKEMTDTYGSDESIWHRKKSNIAVQTCTSVATLVKEQFDSFPTDKQCQIIQDILHCKQNVKPADYLAMVNKKDFSIKFFKFSSCQIPSWAPNIKADGIYLDIYANETQKIARVQVKFNNGIWHNGKTSSLTSSWNVSCNLTDMFTMKPITLSTNVLLPIL